MSEVIELPEVNVYDRDPPPPPPPMGEAAALDRYNNERMRDALVRMGASVEPDTLVPPQRHYAAPAPWAERAVQGAAGSAARWVETAGSLMARNPYPEGSEQWQWYEDNKERVATHWGAETGLGMVAGGGVPSAATLGSGMRRMRRPPPRMSEVVEPNPRAVIGGNSPPENMRLMPEEPPPMGSTAAVDTIELPQVTVEAPPRSWAQGLPRARPANRSTEIPNIRGMSVDDAIAVARTQPHLIRSGDQSEGFYVGGPRDLRSKAGLNKIRRDFDEYIAADPRGGDWYDRYRPAMNEVTGGDPVMNDWMSKQHGQWSAGVDPGSEAHFVLKENNASIAGMPVKAARPAQHEAHLEALAARDPNRYQLGEKTGEYASQITPDRPGPPGATGVNDFRHGRNFTYTEPSGEPLKGALGSAGHKFLDMETALAVDRANRVALGGRTDWTGEKLQAAPWVRQKALDIQARGGRNEDGSFKMSYEEAFARANKTLADFLDRHTFNATHEAQPGADVPGHMMGSVAAGAAERDTFALDPRSNWATAPGGRDAIYSGLGVEGTGNFMRVRPSVPMRGMYTRPDGTTEFNRGQVARPLGTFNTPKTYDKEFVGPRAYEPYKVTTPHDQALLNAGEAVRGLLDAQNASAWHKTWMGGTNKENTSLFFPRSGPASEQELLALRAVAAKHGMGDIVDTGKGITATQFYGGPPAGGKVFDKALKSGEFDAFGEPKRVRSGPGDSGYIDYVPKWQEGVGSGAATRQMLEYVNRTPEIRAAFNNNVMIPERALARLERDRDWAERWGAPREDIQNARRIIGEGRGWVDRIEAALKAGAILPATAAAIFAAAREGSDGRS